MTGIWSWILERHPRFTEGFAEEMPEDVRNGDEAAQNEWLFQQAVWADMVRGGSPGRRGADRSGRLSARRCAEADCG
jgi:hypothetical protein